MSSDCLLETHCARCGSSGRSNNALNLWPLNEQAACNSQRDPFICYSKQRNRQTAHLTCQTKHYKWSLFTKLHHKHAVWASNSKRKKIGSWFLSFCFPPHTAFSFSVNMLHLSAIWRLTGLMWAHLLFSKSAQFFFSIKWLKSRASLTEKWKCVVFKGSSCCAKIKSLTWNCLGVDNLAQIAHT